MTDGYYITGENLGITFFLYKNGVFLQGFAFDMMEKTEVENSYKNGDFYNSIKDNKLHWGLFRVSSNEIIIEGWQPTGGGSFSTYSLKGEIPNDTTIHIMQKWSHGKKEAYNEIYHFKQFNPKPDSTNSFIK